MNQSRAIQKIGARGALLVFPINNKKEPASLWSEFFPKSKMRWEWDDEGDNRVADMWYLMKRLSASGNVVYSKWYQGRATFFSKGLFTALLRVSLSEFENPQLSPTASLLLECLESDSPLSTKQLKQFTDLRGRDNEGVYTRGMKELFNRFLIVAFGEVEDGAFPSLAVGATKNLFEDLLLSAREMKEIDAWKTVDRYFPVGSLFRKFFDKHHGDSNLQSLGR